MAVWDDLPLLSRLGQRPPLGRSTQPPLGRFTTLMARAADPETQPLAAYLVGFPMPPLDEAEDQSLLLPPFTSPGVVESPPEVQARDTFSLPPAEVPTSSPAPVQPASSGGDGEVEPGQKVETDASRLPTQEPDLPSQAAQLPEHNQPVDQTPPIQRKAQGQPPATVEDSLETSPMIAPEGQSVVEALELLAAESQDIGAAPEIFTTENQGAVPAAAVVPDAIAEKLPQTPLPALQRQPLGRTQPLGQVGNTAANITQQLRQKHREAVDSETVRAYDTGGTPEFAPPEASEPPTLPPSEAATTPDLQPRVREAEEASPAQPEQTQGIAAEPTAPQTSELSQGDTAPIQPRVFNPAAETAVPAPNLVEDGQASLSPAQPPDTQNSFNPENLPRQTFPTVEEINTPATFDNAPSAPGPIADQVENPPLDRPAISLPEDLASPTDDAPASPPSDALLRAKPASADLQPTNPAAELPPPVTDSPLGTDRPGQESEQLGDAAAIAPSPATNSPAASPEDWGNSALDTATPPDPQTNAIAPVQWAELSDRIDPSPNQPQSPTAVPPSPPAPDDSQPQKESPTQLAAKPPAESIQPTPETDNFSTEPAPPSPPVSNPEPPALNYALESPPIQRRRAESSTNAWENQFDLDTALPEQSAFQDFSLVDASLPAEMPEAETEPLFDGSESSADPELEAEEATSIAADQQTSTSDVMLDDLAEWVYAELRSHLYRSQTTHYGLHPSLPWRPLPDSYSQRQNQRAANLIGLPPPQLLQLTTLVRQQVESRLRADHERQPTPYLTRL